MDKANGLEGAGSVLLRRYVSEEHLPQLSDSKTEDEVSTFLQKTTLCNNPDERHLSSQFSENHKSRDELPHAVV
jgi:hypothetical protein